MAEISTYWFLNNYKNICAEAQAKMKHDWWKKDKIAFDYAVKLGWYDWFCKESALIGRTLKYGKLIESLVKHVPILGKNTFISFAQRLGEEYIDYFYIGRDKPKFGYGIRVTKEGYYVFRRGRSSGADFESKSFREVVKFIERDVLIWFAGGEIREYEDVPRSYRWQKNDTSSGAIQSRIKATKPFMIVPGTPVGDMFLKYRAKARKSKKR